jgi:hypothetical protein
MNLKLLHSLMFQLIFFNIVIFNKNLNKILGLELFNEINEIIIIICKLFVEMNFLFIKKSGSFLI